MNYQKKDSLCVWRYLDPSSEKCSIRCPIFYVHAHNCHLCITKKEKMCNLEREYRVCIKSRRDKAGITRHIMMHQVLYDVHVTLHWVTAQYIDLVHHDMPTLSLLLFIQTLYSLSKLLIHLSRILFCCF